ncbi:MAG: cardiolipin synthase [Kiritimatiellia bacterium]
MNPEITEVIPQTLGWGTFIHVLSVIILTVHVLRRPGEPRTSLLWIFFAAIFPLLGVTAYILFGINTAEHKGWEKHYSDIRFNRILYRFREPTDPMELAKRGKRCHKVRPEPENLVVLNRIFDRTGPYHPLLGGNSIILLENAESALEEMFTAINNASRNINLCTYILSDDEIGRRLMESLKERAHAGIKVKLMYDAFGSAKASLKCFFHPYKNIPNLEIAGFSQVNILKRKFQLNNRNHRKLLVIDSRTAFTGGINFHDVYITKSGRKGIRDYHFKLSGPVVADLQDTFLRDWFYMTEEPADTLLSPEYFPVPESCGKSAIRVINSGPTHDEKGITLHTLVAAANLAEQQLLIITPYFVPPRSLVLALRLAAHRGVDVRVLVPEKNNHPALQQASHALYEPLLLSGVRIFELSPPFIHSKATIIDDEAAIIGSANLDPRSFYMNYETNLVVFDSEFATTLKRSLIEEHKKAKEITHVNWNQRSSLKRFVENFFNLFHPIA